MRGPTQEQAGTLIAMSAILFGGWVRLMIPWMAGFPVNDGGLFYVMLRDLIANGLRLPSHIQYNGLDIPFAYPPLGFYVGGLVAYVFHIDPIKVLQWLPAVVLIAALPAFYWLAKTVLGSSFRAGIATLIFAFTPRAITWQIMGGGLTRSFGQLFLVLALASIYQTFERYSRRRLALSILFSTLVVLSHPEAALQTAGLAVLIWLFKGRSRQSALHAAEIGAGTLVLSAVWWLPAILSFGVGTLISAAQTGLHNWLALLQPFLLNFVDEPLMTLIAVFGVIGFAYEASQRRALIPLLFWAPFLIDPRSAPSVAMIPLALLAGLALAEVILPALAGLRGEARQAPGVNLMRSTPVMMFLLFIGVYMLGNAFYFGMQLAGTTLSPGTREAFAWVKNNTPAGSHFLVLTGNTATELFCDAPVEWFPALTERTSLTTIQGREWQQGQEFGMISEESRAASTCLNARDAMECVSKLTSSSGSPRSFDFLYVARRAAELTNCRAVGTRTPGERLIDELKATQGYSPIYENADAAVFKRPTTR